MAEKRLKPGAVRDAIVTVLGRLGEASVLEIQAGVSAELGHPVAASSVRSYLNLNVADTFTRVERGRYKLKRRS